MVAHFVVDSWNRTVNGAEAIAVRFRATPTFEKASVSQLLGLTTRSYVIFASICWANGLACVVSLCAVAKR